MAAPSLTYTLTNGQTADASQVMQNFNDLLNGISDGTKDLSINALTCAGTATLNGHVNLGNSSSDDLSITASLASSLPIKTTNTYDIGSATKGLAGVYFGTGDTDTARIVSAALAASRTYTLPDAGGAADFVMNSGTSTIGGSKTFSSDITTKVNHTDLGGSASTDVSTSLLRSGLFTWGGSGAVNVSGLSSSSRPMKWSLVGKVVTCTGTASVTCTSGADADTSFTMTLPITPTSNFSSTEEASGVGIFVPTSPSAAYRPVTIYATTSAKTVTMRFTSNSSSASRELWFSFQYTIN